MEQTAKTQDPLKVAPGTYKLVFENDRVRVLDINVKPGGKAAMHSHPGYVAIALDKKCKVKFTSLDGKEEQAEFKVGDTIWREAESQSVQNIGSTECHVLNIELKESAKIS
jgi:quercetin dioxygenase-like cupin family protein